MNFILSLSRLTALLALSLLLVPTMTAHAQGQREIDLIQTLGQEEIERREAAAKASADAEARATLEAETKLRKAAVQYLNEARRVAQRLIENKSKEVTPGQLEQLRRQARIVIEEVTDPTKQRVRTELDPIYDQLAAMVAVSADEMHQSSPDLLALRRRLAPGSARGLEWVDQAAVMVAMCQTKAHAEIIAANIAGREQLSADEAQAIDLCNYRRLVLGLNPLSIDQKLVECSRDHSNDMVELGFFSHTSPVVGKEKFTQRAKNFGTTASGENIAAGYNNGQAVTLGWWYSPGHLKNMMSRGHNRIAVGQVKQTYTQMFGR